MNRNLFNKLSALHWLVIIMSAILTISAWHLTRQQINEKINYRYKREVNKVNALIEEKMRKYEDALWAGVANIHSQNYQISDDSWRKFAEILKIEDRHPGINGIGIIKPLNSKNINSFIAKKQKTFPGFRIHPIHKNKEYLPIVNIEPISKNNMALGLDIAHEENRYKAAIAARDSGNVRITGPIILVQDSEKTPGFLFYAPFYSQKSDSITSRRKNFEGLVYAPFIVKKLMNGTLDKSHRAVLIKISDNDNVIFSEHEDSNENYKKDPLIKSSNILDLYGRRWKIDFQTTKSFENNVRSNQPIFILIGGMFIDTLLLTLFILIAKSNKKAIEEVDEIRLDLSYNEKRLQSILDSSSDGIILAKKNGDIEIYNNACERIFGYSANEVIGKNISILMNDFSKIADLRKLAMSKAKFINVEIDTKNKEGASLPLEVGIVQVQIGKEDFIIGSIRDITTRREDQKGKDLMVGKLTNSNEELERFAYICSHDLQEPLRMVGSYTKLLQRSLKDIEMGPLLDKVNQYMFYIIDGSKRSQILISDVLEYSKINFQEKMEDINLEDVVTSVLQNISSLIDETDTQIIFNKLPKIKANRVLIGQLFQNMITNAIKYCDQKPKIKISATIKNQYCTICFEDNGIGLDMEYKDKIFEIFQRLEKSPKYSGSGIGLALCKKIVDKHSGKIWVESKIGKGSKFFIKIPI